MLYQLPEALIRAVISAKSGFNPDALSDDAEMGLMQLRPQLALEMGVLNAFDARQSVLGGTRYLRMLANQFNGDLVLTVAAFDAGGDAIEKYRGVPPSPSTRAFVKSVLHLYYEYRDCGVDKTKAPIQPGSSQITSEAEASSAVERSYRLSLELQRCEIDYPTHKRRAPRSYPRIVSVDAKLSADTAEAVFDSVDAWNRAAGFEVFRASGPGKISLTRQVAARGPAWMPSQCGSIWVTEDLTGSADEEADGTAISNKCKATILLKPARPHQKEVAMHELGHALGLAHSSSPDDLMYPISWDRAVTSVSDHDVCLVRMAAGVGATPVRSVGDRAIRL